MKTFTKKFRIPQNEYLDFDNSAFEAYIRLWTDTSELEGYEIESLRVLNVSRLPHDPHFFTVEVQFELQPLTPAEPEPRDIKTELELCLEEVQAQIDAVFLSTRGSPTNAFALRDRNGGFVLTPLLIAKSQLLVTLSDYEELKDVEPIQGATRLVELDDWVAQTNHYSAADGSPACGVNAPYVTLTIVEAVNCLACRALLKQWGLL